MSAPPPGSIVGDMSFCGLAEALLNNSRRRFDLAVDLAAGVEHDDLEDEVAFLDASESEILQDMARIAPADVRPAIQSMALATMDPEHEVSDVESRVARDHVRSNCGVDLLDYDDTD